MVIASANDDKVQMVVAVTPDHVAREEAGALVKALAPIVGGGGAAAVRFCEADGKHPEKIDKRDARGRTRRAPDHPGLIFIGALAGAPFVLRTRNPGALLTRKYRLASRRVASAYLAFAPARFLAEHWSAWPGAAWPQRCDVRAIHHPATTTTRRLGPGRRPGTIDAGGIPSVAPILRSAPLAGRCRFIGARFETAHANGCSASIRRRHGRDRFPSSASPARTPTRLSRSLAPTGVELEEPDHVVSSRRYDTEHDGAAGLPPLLRPGDELFEAANVWRRRRQ